MLSIKMAEKKLGETITDEGYALAPFLLRTTAAAIDAAFLILSFWLIYFFSYQTTLYPTLDEAFSISSSYNQMTEYQKASHLVNITEDGTLSDVSGTYEDYMNSIHEYYFVYNANGNEVNPSPLAYTIKDWNVNILGLPEDPKYRNESEYFNFDKDPDGNDDPTKEGVLKQSLYGDDGKLTESSKNSLKTYFQNKYLAAQDELMKMPYYKSLQDQSDLGIFVVLSISFVTPFLIFYLILPLASKYNATLGKRFMGLMVIDYRGKPLKKWLLSIRTIPALVSFIIALLLNSIIYSLSFMILVFMISWGLSIFSKRKRALHDFVSLSVVARKDEDYLEVSKEIEK